MARFDVLPNETIAVCSESGHLRLTSMENGSVSMGENIFGSKAEFIKATPTGNHLIAFAKGVLYIFKLNASPKQPDLSIKTTACSRKSV